MKPRALLSYFLGFFLTLSALGAERPATVDDAIHALCSGGATEGRYDGNLPTVGTIRISLICVGNQEITASVVQFTKVAPVTITLGFAALDGHLFTLAAHDLSEGGSREIAPLEPTARLELDYASLLKGTLTGQFIAGISTHPSSFTMQRDGTFPNFLSITDHSQDYLNGLGTFAVTDGPSAQANNFPKYINVDVTNGIQRITYQDATGANLSVYEGMFAKGAGNVFYASSGLAETSGLTTPLIHIRGRLNGPDQIEFYFFRSGTGMQGPFHASHL